MATLLNRGSSGQLWWDISMEQYTRALDKHSSVGRLNHHQAILMKPKAGSKPDARFDAMVSQLFYFTKAFLVEIPFFAARESMLVVIGPIVYQNKKAETLDIPQTDGDNFLTAVSHLFLASLDPELLKKNNYKTSKKHHLQTVYTALKKIGSPACPTEQAKTCRIHPRYVLAPSMG